MESRFPATGPVVFIGLVSLKRGQPKRKQHGKDYQKATDQKVYACSHTVHDDALFHYVTFCDTENRDLSGKIYSVSFGANFLRFAGPFNVFVPFLVSVKRKKSLRPNKKKFKGIAKIPLASAILCGANIIILIIFNTENDSPNLAHCLLMAFIDPEKLNIEIFQKKQHARARPNIVLQSYGTSFRRKIFHN